MALRLPDWLRYELREKWERVRDKWERLPARRWINERPKLIIAIACVSAFSLLVAIIVHLAPAEIKRIEPIEKEWFYDLNSGKLFIADKELIAPIEAPSGALPSGEPAGVRAYVLSYASQAGESGRFIGFLETANPDAEDEGADSSDVEAGGARQWGCGKLICRVEDEQWVAADSDEGRAILEEAFIPNENGERPRYVRPK